MATIAQVKDKDIPTVGAWSTTFLHGWRILTAAAAFTPLLKAKKALIREIPNKTFTYGPTGRHQVGNLNSVHYPASSLAVQCQHEYIYKLDIYYPITPQTGGILWVAQNPQQASRHGAFCSPYWDHAFQPNYFGSDR